MDYGLWDGGFHPFVWAPTWARPSAVAPAEPSEGRPCLYVYIDSASDLYVGGPLSVQSLENKYPFSPCTIPILIVDDQPLWRIPTNICI